MTHSQPAADSHEIRALTGIRGFAAMLVVGFHYYGSWVLLLPCLSLVERPLGRGYLGVDLFFILSGFILSYVYNAGNRKLNLPEYGRFLWFRLARIYPNHLAMLLLLVFLVTAAPLLGFTLTGVYALDSLPFQLTLTHSWPIAPNEYAMSWNFPAWSISAEWFAYLAIFPLVAFLLQRIRNSILALLLGFGALEAWPVFCLILSSHHRVADNYELVHVSCEFFAGGMFFSAFLLGSGVARFCQRQLTGLFVVLLVLLWNVPSLEGNNCILSILPLLLLGLTSEVSLAGRLFSTPPALWLGRVSYALYMSHGIAIKLIKVLLPSAHYIHCSLAFRLLVFLANLTIIFAMAAGLYYLVEIPARNYLRKIRPPWSRHEGKPG